jgi:IS605 OrfB family transposase
MACQVKDKVCASYKAQRKKRHDFHQPFLPLSPARTLSLNREQELASISTLRGRLKVPLALGDYQRSWLAKSIKIRESEIKGQGNELYLHLVIEVPDGAPINPTSALGVDLGLRNIATTSEGQSYTGDKIKAVRARYRRLRSILQAKGTLSSRRHLRRLSGREKRFQAAVNHLVSRRIVDRATELKAMIVLEDLKGLKRARVRKEQRWLHDRWAFSQLRNFLSYKARLAGIPLLLVNPRNTSRTCSQCGSLGLRNGSNFHCPSCGYVADSDLNAAINLALRAAVNRPIVSDSFTLAPETSPIASAIG